MNKLTKDEKSLLLFFETRATDYGGRVNIQHMNVIDIKIAENWNKDKFVEYGRIVARNCNNDGSMYCKLSIEAIKMAHALRIEKQERMWLNRKWISVDENRIINGDPRISGMNS